MLAIRKN